MISKHVGGSMVDMSKVVGIPEKEECVNKSIEINAQAWKEFKAQCKKNGHTIKDALDFGIRAYMVSYKGKKK